MLQSLFNRRLSTAVPPVLFIAGAQKCGTTTLWSSLSKHPQVRAARDPDTGKPVKELGFFAGQRQKCKGLSTLEQRTLFGECFPPKGGMKLDATPQYLPSTDSHEVMAKAYPDAHFVVSLRNPVVRAYSHYNHYMQVLSESASWVGDWVPGESFAKNVEIELSSFDPARPKTSGLVGRGRYVVQLRSLLKHFPREQVKVVILERWSQDPRKLHNELLKYLKLVPWRLSAKVRHSRDKTTNPMDDKTRSLLVEHYRDYNRQLEELLGEEIPEWT